MMRLPDLRRQLQILNARDDQLRSFCGAFEEASSMLDRLRRQADGADPEIIREYEQLCVEIEQEVISICMTANERSANSY